MYSYCYDQSACWAILYRSSACRGDYLWKPQPKGDCHTAAPALRRPVLVSKACRQAYRSLAVLLHKTGSAFRLRGWARTVSSCQVCRTKSSPRRVSLPAWLDDATVINPIGQKAANSKRSRCVTADAFWPTTFEL